MMAYRRSVWFRLVREPLKFGMRAWVRMAKIDLSGYRFTTPACLDCTRFYKNALKDHSATFRRANGIINPLFDRMLEGLVGPEAVLEARNRAETRDQAELPDDLERWTRI